MKRIDLTAWIITYQNDPLQVAIAKAINEIMDYLEKNLPEKNGKFYKCKNCGHTTMYQGDLDCCGNPDFEVIN